MYVQICMDVCTSAKDGSLFDNPINENVKEKSDHSTSKARDIKSQMGMGRSRTPSLNHLGEVMSLPSPPVRLWAFLTLCLIQSPFSISSRRHLGRFSGSLNGKGWTLSFKEIILCNKIVKNIIRQEERRTDMMNK